MVKQDVQVTGLPTLHNVKTIHPAAWNTTTAAQVMIPVAAMKRIRPEAELADALGEMDRDGSQPTSGDDRRPNPRRVGTR